MFAILSTHMTSTGTSFCWGDTWNTKSDIQRWKQYSASSWCMAGHSLDLKHVHIYRVGFQRYCEHVKICIYLMKLP